MLDKIIGGKSPHRAGLGLDGSVYRDGIIFLADLIGLEHPFEDVVPATFSVFGLADGVVVIGPLDHADQHGGFSDAEVPGVFVEVIQRRGLHSVDLAPPEDFIEVDFQNLFLAEGGFDAQGQNSFLHLA